MKITRIIKVLIVILLLALIIGFFGLKFYDYFNLNLKKDRPEPIMGKNPDELEDDKVMEQVEDKTLEPKDNENQDDKEIPTPNQTYYVEESLDWIQMTNGDAEGIFKLKAFTRDGDLNWSRSWDGIPLTQIDVIHDIVTDGSFLYLALENHIYKLDLNKGEEIWSLDMEGLISSIYTRIDYIVVLALPLAY